MFNAKSQPLTNHLSKFLVSIYKAEGMTAAELKVNPGLTITQDIINSWCQITLTQHQEFVLGVTNVTERLFSSPDIEAELSVAVRKRRHETQLATFNKLQTLAAEKIVQLDDFIGLQVYVRYELFAEKSTVLSSVDCFVRGKVPLLKHPPSTLRTPQFKPIESFLESRCKPMPWFTVSSTSVSSEQCL